MASLPIVFLGNPALRRVSKAVAQPRSATVRALLANLEEQVYRVLMGGGSRLQRKEEGVGIAAPQLGVNSRVFLMLKDAPQSEDDLEDGALQYQECINPEILKKSAKEVKDYEGCLSIPGYVGVVKRAQEIQVQYNDAQGQRHKKTLRDFPARIFQHELDHLDGVLYLDRLEKNTLIHNDEFRLLSREEIAKILRD